MSESTRALCAIITRRPFVALSDRELQMVSAAVRAVTNPADPMGDWETLREALDNERRSRRESEDLS